jgi:phosphatidylserine decarboxylase
MVYDRTTGRVEPEKVMGGRSLRLLYGNPLGRALACSVLKRRFFSRFIGRRQDQAGSAGKIEKVAAELGIDLSEAEKPAGEYSTFNEFFTRALKEGARPVEDLPGAVISPCDARLMAYPRIEPDRSVTVKGSRVDLNSLVRDESLARTFAGGALLVYRLCPVDYHRFHFPEACTPGHAVILNGGLHSVNPWALSTGLRILDTNLRARTLLENAGPAHTICMIEVGAMCVGSIVQTYGPGAPVKRGDEKGMFRFGGSTVIVLYEPDRIRLDEDIASYSKKGIETLVRLGRPVGQYL